MSAIVLQGDARALPLPDASVDLVVTSPPYFGLRSYTDGGKHYTGQIGAEATPGEFLDALIAVTREMVRVLKSSGSIFLNMGDRYAGGGGQWDNDDRPDPGRRRAVSGKIGTGGKTHGFRHKSLMLLPERYRIRAVDELGLIARAVIVWDKPNGLPESVTDRVRRSHEDWVHLTKQPRYYSAVDEIREAHDRATYGRLSNGSGFLTVERNATSRRDHQSHLDGNPLGKLPGSVWNIPTDPLILPEWLGVEHYAAFPIEWPRRIIQGWSPRGVCVECGEGRRPVVEKLDSIRTGGAGPHNNPLSRRPTETRTWFATTTLGMSSSFATVGYACACPEPVAPTTPGVVLDPLGGTGTTALVAHALGRTGIIVDLSHDYCRAACWRTTDPAQVAKAMRVPKPQVQMDGQADLFGELA